MNEFVGTVPFLRIALGFDMKTMHFHITQTGLFFRTICFCIYGVAIKNFTPMKNCSGMQGRSNKLPY